ncbi:MAG: OmpA family protein [Acidobacteriaceae bacterium]|nr:OmpA family protein [Acidobacteriaceae bacterium]
MKQTKTWKLARGVLGISAAGLLAATLAMARVEPNTRTFTAGEKSKVQGVIVAHQGDTLKVRGDDDSIGTVDLTNTTKIELKKSFGRHTAMNLDSLVPGLRVEVQGKGSDKGDLIAEKVTFDPNSMKASRQIDTRVAPLEARTGTLEGRTGTLENRAGQMETRQGQLEDTEKQTQTQVGQVQTQVGQVKTEADQANQGVSDVNNRVSDLDNYDTKYSEVVYFRINSTVLSAEDKQKLDDLAQKALNEKGYVVEVAGFADKTGNAALNQDLSEKRAHAVIQYLEEQGNIPIHRILTPAGMGTTHEAAANNTAAGRKLNRRVEVKVLVNKGVVAGSGNGTQPTTSSAKQPGDTSH